LHILAWLADAALGAVQETVVVDPAEQTIARHAPLTQTSPLVQAPHETP
jgi:hypothetical protein